MRPKKERKKERGSHKKKETLKQVRVWADINRYLRKRKGENVRSSTFGGGVRPFVVVLEHHKGSYVTLGTVTVTVKVIILGEKRKGGGQKWG